MTEPVPAEAIRTRIHPRNEIVAPLLFPQATAIDLDAIKALLAQLPEVTLARIEAGPIAVNAIKSTAAPAPTGPGLPLSPIWGVPLAPRNDFGHPAGCCWRGIGTDGSTMREGCVIDWERVAGLDAHAATEQASEDAGARLEADSQWRRLGGERRG